MPDDSPVMSRQFRAIAILLGLAAIAYVVIAHPKDQSGVNPLAGSVDVLVAAKPIPKGTRGEVIRSGTGYYRVLTIAPSEAKPGVILDPSGLAGKVALTNIGVGEMFDAANLGPRRRRHGSG
jgi:flagella basal body P-ring formation protein FlgA